MSLTSRTKKILAGTATVFVIGALGMSSATLRAQASGDLSIILSAIKQDTGAIKADTDSVLALLNTLPAQLNAIIQAVVALNITWTQTDTSDTSASLQSSFSTVSGTALTNAANNISSVQSTLLTSFLSPTVGGGMPPYYTVPLAVTASTFPYANDMTFQTLLGKPYFATDPRPKTDANGNAISYNAALNYIKNASGMNITHTIPNPNWIGSSAAKTNYFNFYTTVNAIQTYDAYLVGQLYADLQGGSQLTAQQNALITQSSSSDWFAQVASENIGYVLRQILMYNSQMYVLLTQLLQVQKQSLAAQAMTNTLIIIGDQYGEGMLVRSATSNR